MARMGNDQQTGRQHARQGGPVTHRSRITGGRGGGHHVDDQRLDGMVLLEQLSSRRQVDEFVDRLADSGFDVGAIAVVGRDLQLLQRPRGGTSTAVIALVGMAAGAVVGGVSAFMIGLFDPRTPAAAAWGALLLGVLIGAVVGLVAGLLLSALTAGRSHSLDGRLTARRYDVLVEREQLVDARRMAGPADSRHTT